MSSARVEILSFSGCPHAGAAYELVESVAAELGLDPEIEVIEVSDNEQAAALRFLGSPTVRIGGRDVEPGSAPRRDYVLACRIYCGDEGASGLPRREWIREALVR